jgi:hypothetical protein
MEPAPLAQDGAENQAGVVTVFIEVLFGSDKEVKWLLNAAQVAVKALSCCTARRSGRQNDEQIDVTPDSSLPTCLGAKEDDLQRVDPLNDPADDSIQLIRLVHCR